MARFAATRSAPFSSGRDARSLVAAEGLHLARAREGDPNAVATRQGVCL